MAVNIIDTTPTTIPRCGAILIQVNNALTGTITVTAGGITQAVITNPIAGNVFRYGNLSGLVPIVITASATPNISVTSLSRTH